MFIRLEISGDGSDVDLWWCSDILQQNRKDKRNDTIYRIKVLDTGALESWISPKTCVTCKIFVVKSNLTCFLEWERNSIFPRQNVEIDLICSLVVWHKQLPLFNSNNHTPHFVLFSPTLNLAFHGLVSC